MTSPINYILYCNNIYSRLSNSDLKLQTDVSFSRGVRQDLLCNIRGNVIGVNI